MRSNQLQCQIFKSAPMPNIFCQSWWIKSQQSNCIFAIVFSLSLSLPPSLPWLTGHKKIKLLSLPLSFSLSAVSLSHTQTIVVSCSNFTQSPPPTDQAEMQKQETASQTRIPTCSLSIQSPLIYFNHSTSTSSCCTSIPLLPPSQSKGGKPIT